MTVRGPGVMRTVWLGLALSLASDVQGSPPAAGGRGGDARAAQESAGRPAPRPGSPGTVPAASQTNRCLACHADLASDERDPSRLFAADDVHRAQGFTCASCHGGDPSTDDMEQAKAPARGFLGVPAGRWIIAVCGRCHSDAEFMRRFAPRQRVDQASEYTTSVHGKRLASGDTRVATCVSCHGAHGIRRVNDPRSPVFATSVAATCGRCHASAEHMKGYRQADGSAVSTMQRVDYERSVHHEALAKRNDLGAPTCNDCHGNHGAAPPGVGTVANVCGTCHAAFAEKFRTSVHSEVFERGCAECHGHHAVLRPTDDLVGAGPPAICAGCHSPGDEGLNAATRIRGDLDGLKAALDRATSLVARARNAGMEVSDEELALAEARTRLTMARTDLHGFTGVAARAAVDEGRGMAAAIERAGQEALAELDYRRRGLFGSLAAILLVVVALAFKIRQIEARQHLAGARELRDRHH